MAWLGRRTPGKISPVPGSRADTPDTPSMVLARSMHSEPCRGYPSPRKKEALLACQLASGALFRLGIPLATTDHRCREDRRGEVIMHRTTASYLSAAVLAFAALLMAAPDPLPAQQTAQVAIDHDDIGGVVRSRSGPEAGVWVIAETTELPTKYAKMVVTDDKGRYVIPDLPTANYSVWVRGYGLVDSPKVRAKPGQQLDLTAVPAPDERAAAHCYPAIYWYTMMKIPPAKDFGGTTDIPKNVTKELWRQRMNNVDCIGCHQLGQESTRTIPAALGEFKSGAEAWARRIASGQTGEFMMNRLAVQLGGVPFKYFGDWTDRVAKGELPRHKPPRPQGVERNVVVTSWEWGTEKTFIHDLISSDRRNPTVNAYGPLYGSNEYSSDNMPILDPKTHKVTFFKMSVADPDAPESFGPPFHASAAMKPMLPSAYWGEEKIWSQRANNHNGMFDKKGRVWFAAAVRGIENPAFCKKGSEHPSDGSVWYTFNVFVGRPGFLRFDPKTKLSEFYAIPKEGIGVRGGDIDKNGLLWGSGSNGSLVSFDRRKCSGPLNGPKATGDHCPQGFAFHKYPGPGFEGFENTSAEASYYTWVDHHNTAGLGENVPISTANLQDGFVAFKDGKMILMRVPYPMGFFAKGLDGRIDDPNAGWKGRGLWSTNGDRTPWLMEGGKGAKPRVVHIQVRPDPLAH